MYLITSSDNGATWSTPRTIAPPGSGQIDVQIKVDPMDGSTVYASWLQNNKSLIEVAKSTDFGATWTTVIANSTEAGTDKDIPVGGNTWTATLLDVSGSPPDCSAFSCGWAFLGPGIAMTSDAAGQVYVLWNAGTVDQRPERMWYSTSKDQDATWSQRLMFLWRPSE